MLSTSLFICSSVYSCIRVCNIDGGKGMYVKLT